MSGAHRAEKVPRRGRPLSGLLVAAAVLLGATGGLGTFAYWNDVETVSGGTVTAGSLDLTVNGVQGPYVWNVLQMNDMAPGESVAASLVIENAGSTPFTVTVTGAAATTGAVSVLPYVTATVRVGGTASSDDDYPRTETCSGGTLAFESKLTTASQPLATTTVIPRSPGSSTLCVSLSLAGAAPMDVQRSTFTPSFELTATQVRP
ncbi:hypothetical protein NOK12_20950 [Nocardioides sp. OK12]|uniref:TasA family protein n=1 Tax=Nocardioides sp. OK12 TaxID=2758661 RepID=UPI0021C3A31B|nr:TasA family protein [Nocardioides sp. OK12]GHJ59577.1 hypothetical protein NOK12_20950 [Nocardioides sp. OK12]